MTQTNLLFNFKPYRGLSAFNLYLINKAFGPCCCSILLSPDEKLFIVRLFHPRYIWYFDSKVCHSLEEVKSYLPFIF